MEPPRFGDGPGRRGARTPRPSSTRSTLPISGLLVATLLGLPLAPAVSTGQEAPRFATARDAVDSLATIRTRAEPLWREGDPEGLALLEKAWSFLEQAGVVDLRSGSTMLQSRVFNLAFETACAHAVRGDTAAALRGLKKIYDTGGPHAFAESIEERCQALYVLREEPAYRRVLALWRSERLRWGGASLATPYRERLPGAERVAGLSLLWSEIKMGFPSFEVAPGLDLDSLYLAYLPRVRSSDSTLEYYRTLTRFIAELRDSHSNVYYPPELRSRVYSRPPLRTLLVDGRVIVRRVLSPRLEQMGIEVGQEVVAIDGVPSRAYAEEHVAPYVAASTPQDRALRTYGYQLLAGDSARAVRLTLEGADGRRREVEVPRSGYDEVRPLRATRDGVLAGSIGYLRIDGFDADTLTDYLREAVARLSDTDALVIDVRWNGGGNTAFGDRLLEMLAVRSTPVRRSRTRPVLSLARAWGLPPIQVPVGTSTIDPDPELHYGAPVVVLTSPMTFSAAEDFVVAFDEMERGTIIGEPTAGNTGQPFFFRLPGGGSARVRTKHDSYADGEEFIGVGVRPDIPVAPTVEGIRAGRDEVLEAALRFLEDRTRQGRAIGPAGGSLDRRPAPARRQP